LAGWQVTELVGSKADLAGEVEAMKLRVERTQLKMGDLVDRVKLQQTELEVRRVKGGGRRRGRGEEEE
jgi:hypothetical protein